MMISIDGYVAKTQELGYWTDDKEWVPNGAVEHLANQVETLREQLAAMTKERDDYKNLWQAASLRCEKLIEIVGDLKEYSLYPEEIEAAMKGGE